MTTNRLKLPTILQSGIRAAALSLCIASLTASAFADSSIALTDKTKKGSGTINLLKDMSASQLQSYLNSNGMLSLGIDVNESNGGNESAASNGVALKNVEMVITTTTGTYKFSKFATDTSASITAKGASAAQEFYTVFGKTGSSSINGGHVSADDVIVVKDVQFTGTILSASVNVQLLETAKIKGDNNESFFDFSAGFEDYSLLSAADAIAVDAAKIGVAAAPSSISFKTAATPLVTLKPVAPVVVEKPVEVPPPVVVAPAPVPVEETPAPEAEAAPVVEPVVEAPVAPMPVAVVDPAPETAPVVEPVVEAPAAPVAVVDPAPAPVSEPAVEVTEPAPTAPVSVAMADTAPADQPSGGIADAVGIDGAGDLPPMNHPPAAPIAPWTVLVALGGLLAGKSFLRR